RLRTGTTHAQSRRLALLPRRPPRDRAHAGSDRRRDRPDHRVPAQPSGKYFRVTASGLRATISRASGRPERPRAGDEMAKSRFVFITFVLVLATVGLAGTSNAVVTPSPKQVTVTSSGQNQNATIDATGNDIAFTSNA